MENAQEPDHEIMNDKEIDSAPVQKSKIKIDFA